MQYDENDSVIRPIGASSPDVVDELAMPEDRRAELVIQSRDGIVARVSSIVANALIQMSEELSLLASKKEDFNEQRALHDAVSVVKMHRLEIETRFRQSFAQIFQQRLQGLPSMPEQPELNEHELALVDDAFMRDKLKVQRLIEQARSQLDPDEVLGMRARLAVLVDREWFDEDQHPAAPEAVFEALKVAVDEIGGEAEVKSALLDAFAPYVADQLNAVYSAANAELRDQHVLPKIKARVAINPDTGRPFKDDEEPASSDDVSPIDGIETFILPKNGPEREAILEALARELAAGGQEARTSAVQILTEPENFGVADLPMPDADVDLINVLDSIQTLEHAGPNGATEALKDLTEQTRANASPLDQLTVEIVSLIFDFLYQDPRIPQPIKNQLLRLQVVAVKAALLDRSFFASRHHPMRRLIDQTTDISCDPEADCTEGGSFTTALSELVDWVLHEFDRDLIVFEQAVDKLARLASAELGRRAAELAELTSESEREETEGMAREQATNELDARCDGLTPEFIRLFLMESWVEIMVQAKLDDKARESHSNENAEQDGQTNDPLWAVRLITAEQMLWSIAPKSPTEIKTMALMLPSMINGVATGMKTVEVRQGQHSRFFDELMKWHTKIIANAKRQVEPSAAPRSSSLALDADGSVRFSGQVASSSEDASVGAADGSETRRIDSLKRGQRFELRLAGIAPISVKLAFISPAKKLFALARFPDFAQSFDREDLAQMLRDSELVRLIEKASIDRAIAAVGGVEPPASPVAGAPAGVGESDSLTLSLTEEGAESVQIPV